jgi:hypothetical protein
VVLFIYIAYLGYNQYKWLLENIEVKLIDENGQVTYTLFNSSGNRGIDNPGIWLGRECGEYIYFEVV